MRASAILDVWASAVRAALSALVPSPAVPALTRTEVHSVGGFWAANALEPPTSGHPRGERRASGSRRRRCVNPPLKRAVMPRPVPTRHGSVELPESAQRWLLCQSGGQSSRSTACPRRASGSGMRSHAGFSSTSSRSRVRSRDRSVPANPSRSASGSSMQARRTAAS